MRPADHDIGPDHPLLRRADWRFLLPGPAPRRAACYGGDALRRVTAFVADTLVDPADAAAGSCDLVAVAHPDPATLASACAALRPGGVAYVEGPSRHDLAARLGAAGLTEIRLYLATPPPSTSATRAWIQLQPRAAAAYFASSRGRLQALAFRRAPHLFTHLPWLLAPGQASTIVSVARKPGTAPAEALVDRIAQHLDGDVSLLLRAEDTSTDQAILFAFAGDDPTPRLVTKATRGDWDTLDLEREIEILTAMQARFPSVEGVPRLFFDGRYGGCRAQAQSVIDGPPLTESKDTQNVASRVTDWLVRLGTETRHAASTEWPGNLVGELVAELSTTADRALLERTTERLRDLRLPVHVVQHGDLGPWNIHVGANGTIGVIDWCDTTIDGVPAADLIYFLTMWTAHVENAFDGGRVRTPAGGAFRACLDRYLTSLDLSPSTAPALRLLTWMHHTRLEPESKRAGSLFFELWQAEVTE